MGTKSLPAGKTYQSRNTGEDMRKHKILSQRDKIFPDGDTRKFRARSRPIERSGRKEGAMFENHSVTGSSRTVGPDGCIMKNCNST